MQNPRWIDSSHVVSPQARGERRADLRNKLIGVVQIVPSDADNVPALGLEVALAFALAGKVLPIMQSWVKAALRFGEVRATVICAASRLSMWRPRASAVGGNRRTRLGVIVIGSK